jgi:predicted component of type VI protein secretion system
MSFRDDAWSIESLSETAPVRVNDATIAVADGPRRLVSGDRVRMGDVEFEFRWP